MRSIIALISLLLILLGINWAIVQKESHLENGAIAYLKLMPVDPRSLMQGDYMALSFKLADNIIQALPKSNNNLDWHTTYKTAASDGHVVVTLDGQRVAVFKEIYRETSTLAKNEMKMQFRIRNGRVKFATNAFFFQEGAAGIYEKAEYGQFRVNKKGEILLAAMYDKELNKIEAK